MSTCPGSKPKLIPNNGKAAGLFPNDPDGAAWAANFPTLMFKGWSPISFGAWGILWFGLFSVLAALGGMAEEGRLHNPALRAVGGAVRGTLAKVVGGVAGGVVGGGRRRAVSLLERVHALLEGRAVDLRRVLLARVAELRQQQRP